MMRLMWLGVLAGLALAASAQAQQAAPAPGKTYNVGYSQIVDHPALTATRNGFLEGLKEAGFIEGKNLDFRYLNAQGDVANARNIAEKFIADKVDVMTPCTTPNVQAAIRLTKGTDLPVVFGCVTNPVDSGILAALDKPTGTNVTGIYGIPPVAKMWDVLMKLHPNAKIVGTIFNPAESNSAALNILNLAEAKKRGVTWAEVHITSSAEMLTAAQALVTKADSLLMPQDNTVASAFDAVVRVAREKKIPLFSYDTSAVERGAIASYAQNQFKAGKDWAHEMVVPVLLGKAPGSMTPATYTMFDLLLNKGTADAMGITLPPEMIASALKVWND